MTLTTPRKVVLGALLLTVVGGAGWLAGQRQAYSAIVEQAPPSTQPDEAASADIEEPPVEPAPVAANTAATNALPLPPRDAPPAQVIEELLPRARAGDARAACRIAVEMMACAHAQSPSWPQLVDEATAADTQDIGDHAASVLTFLGWADDALVLSQRCKELPDTGQSPNEWLRQAANGGSVEAALRYLEGEGLIYAEPGRDLPEYGALGMLGDPAFLDWYRDAPRLLEDLARRGSVNAYNMLAMAYEFDAGLIAGRIPNDPVRAAMFNVLYREGTGRSGDLDASGRLTPEQRESAEAMLAQWRATTAPLATALNSRDRALFMWNPGVLAKVHNEHDPSRRDPCE